MTEPQTESPGTESNPATSSRPERPAVDTTFASMHSGATAIVEQMIADKSQLGLEVSTTASGITLINGTDTQNELAARLAVQALLGGGNNFAEIFHRPDGKKQRYVEVTVNDHHTVRLLGGQFAGIQNFQGPGDPPTGEHSWVGMVSGPGRMLVVGGMRDETSSGIGYDEALGSNDKAVFFVENGRDIAEADLDAFVEDFAGTDGRAKFQAKDVVFIAANCDSFLGRVNVAGRGAETFFHSLHHIGLSTGGIVKVISNVDLAPSVGDDRRSLCLTNDLIRHGSDVTLVVKAEAYDYYRQHLPMVPACAREDTFHETFAAMCKRVGPDMGALNPDFRVRQITLQVAGATDASQDFTVAPVEGNLTMANAHRNRALDGKH